jgi:propionyl-CoA synthetase
MGVRPREWRSLLSFVGKKLRGCPATYSTYPLHPSLPAALTIYRNMDAHARSLSSPDSFWAQEASRLSWTTPPQTVLQTHASPDSELPRWSWFPDGSLSASYNLVTRHVLDGRGDDLAVIWDSPVSGEKRRISYGELQTEMELAAEVLRNLGVKKGGRVLIYSE